MSDESFPGDAVDAGRRRVLRLLAGTSLLAPVLAACNTAGPNLGVEQPASSASNAPPVIPGKVRVALILPLSAGGNTGAVATSLKNAAEMAVAEFNGSVVQLLPKDDKGTAEGARQAAEEALAEGAEVILGPLLASSVQAVGQVAKPAGRPVVAFSTDASVATRGVYLLSFMPESDVDTIITFAAGRGKRSVAALIPNSAYGTIVAAALQETAARRNMRIAALERFDAAGADAAVKRIVAASGGADALFLPVSAAEMATLGPVLTANGVPGRMQTLGTGVWDDPRLETAAAVQGGWFAAPDKAGFNAFAGRYRAKFGSQPARIATLAYDAVFLLNALHAKYGTQAFTDANFTDPEGIIGTDGLFRFRPDGTNQRGLAVLQVNNGSASTIQPAPRNFAAGT